MQDRSLDTRYQVICLDAFSEELAAAGRIEPAKLRVILEDDALHTGTALEWGAESFVHSDKRQAAAARILEVRDYRPEDLEGVLALVAELEAEMSEKSDGVSIKSGGPEYRNRYLKPGNKFKTFVALLDGRVVGYLLGWPVLGAPEVDTMYDVLPASGHWKPAEFYFHITFVSKPSRNRGISKKLNLTALKYAYEQGYQEVWKDRNFLFPQVVTKSLVLS